QNNVLFLQQLEDCVFLCRVELKIPVLHVIQEPAEQSIISRSLVLWNEVVECRCHGRFYLGSALSITSMAGRCGTKFCLFPEKIVKIIVVCIFILQPAFRSLFVRDGIEYFGESKETPQGILVSSQIDSLPRLISRDDQCFLPKPGQSDSWKIVEAKEILREAFGIPVQ